MPKSDDELRELFAKGRAEDRDAVPPFEATWRAATVAKGRAGWPVALAAAAALAVAGYWLMPETPAPAPVAETNPVPDLPRDGGAARGPDEDAELAALAAWAPTGLDAPSDFLLDDDGVLGGGLPSTNLNDPVLDFEGLSTEL